MWSEICDAISRSTQEEFNLRHRHSLGGGCINQAYRLVGEGKSYFVKVNNASSLDMFVAEAEGLREIYDTNTILVPKPICYGVAGNQSYLVLEYLELGEAIVIRGK